MDREKIINETIDELYSQYEIDHSMRSTIYVHPMFYNGTFSKNNEYQLEEPEPLLSKEEFTRKITLEPDSKWGFGFQILYLYISKQ